MRTTYEWTDARQEDCEVRILLGYNGCRLRRAREEVLSMLDSFQLESPSTEGALQHDIAVTIFSMRYRHHWEDYS